MNLPVPTLALLPFDKPKITLSFSSIFSGANLNIIVLFTL